MRKTVPSPGAVRSSTRPPWAVTSEHTIARPRPAPLAPRPGCATRRRGRSGRTPARLSGGHARAGSPPPGPPSAPSVPTPMRTGVPGGVWATALPTRLVTTCRSRASSPSTGARPGRAGRRGRSARPGGSGPGRAGRAGRRRPGCAGPSGAVQQVAVPSCSSSWASSSRSSTSPVSRAASLSMRRMVRSTSAARQRAHAVQLGEALDAGQRRAQLVADVRDEARILASDAARAANAVSICAEHPVERRGQPADLGAAAGSGTRRVRSPPAIAAAVSSIRRSGRRPRPTANQPTPVSTTSSTAPTDQAAAAAGRWWRRPRSAAPRRPRCPAASRWSGTARRTRQPSRAVGGGQVDRGPSAGDRPQLRRSGGQSRGGQPGTRAGRSRPAVGGEVGQVRSRRAGRGARRRAARDVVGARRSRAAGVTGTRASSISRSASRATSWLSSRLDQLVVPQREPEHDQRRPGPARPAAGPRRAASTPRPAAISRSGWLRAARNPTPRTVWMSLRLRGVDLAPQVARCTCRRCWRRRRSRSATPGPGSAPWTPRARRSPSGTAAAGTRWGTADRAGPPRVTWWPSASSARSPTASTPAWCPPVRRRIARIRAISSSRSNGLVT